MGTALQLEQLSMRYTGMLGANTPSFPDARPRSDRLRCGGREGKFLQLQQFLLMQCHPED